MPSGDAETNQTGVASTNGSRSGNGTTSRQPTEGQRLGGDRYAKIRSPKKDAGQKDVGEKDAAGYRDAREKDNGYAMGSRYVYTRARKAPGWCEEGRNCQRRARN